MFSSEELFCLKEYRFTYSVDDFCHDFELGWKQHLLKQEKCRWRNRFVEWQPSI